MTLRSEPKVKKPKRLVVEAGDPDAVNWNWMVPDAQRLSRHWKADHPRGIDVRNWSDCAQCASLIAEGDRNAVRRKTDPPVKLNIHRTRKREA